MSANPISKSAYYEITKSGKANTQINKILNHIIVHGSKTRRQLSKELGMETSTISARINKLKELRLITDEKSIVCPVSKKTVGLIELVKKCGNCSSCSCKAK